MSLDPLLGMKLDFTGAATSKIEGFGNLTENQKSMAILSDIQGTQSMFSKMLLTNNERIQKETIAAIESTKQIGNVANR